MRTHLLVTDVTAPIKYRTLYTCVRCGKQEKGTTAKIEVGSVVDLIEFLVRPPQRSHDMPVGWASHHGEGFSCGCKKEGP